MGNTALLLVVALFLWAVDANDVNLARIHRRMMKAESVYVNADPDPALIFQQTLDHFTPMDNPVYWNQRYFVNNTYWRPNGPAFLIIGGEGEMSAADVQNNSVVQMAKEYGAIVFCLEHRFYGESVPFELLNTSALEYLTSEQALADLVKFRMNMLGQYNMPENTKWAIFGCSYAGALAAWFRLKFPQLAFVALSGSSPVEAISSFYQYDQVVNAGLDAKCANGIRNATQLITNILNGPDSETFKNQLGCGGITDNVAVLYVLADVVAYAVQYNRSMGQYCAEFENSTDVVATYINFAQYIFNITRSTCYDYDISNFTNEDVSPDSMMRQWMWQSCSEFGYFQTAPQNNSLRSPLITEQWHFSVCAKLFNNVSNEPRTSWTNAYYGGYNISTSNTIFSNGGRDPWAVLSVTHDLSPSVPSIVIDGVAHCANWRLSSSSDSAALTQGRAQVSAFLGAFLDSCHNVTNMKGCGSNGMCTYERGSDNSVTSKCACVNGYGGVSCDSKAAKDMKVPWWALLVAGGGALIIGFAIGGFMCARIARSRVYQSV